MPSSSATVSTAEHPAVTADVYAALGVRRLINAYETVSVLGGTRTHPEVLDAMRAASDAFVDLRELQSAVGARLATLTRNEAAAVTSGASAGMVLAAAACAARRDPAFLGHLMRAATLPRPEVIVQRCQLSPYVQNVRQAGVELVEVGYAHNATPEEMLEQAFGDLTVAVLYTAGRPYERDAIPIERVVALAHEQDVPVIVDAAALLPPAANLWRFTGLGADLVVFSGGKGLQGPQDSGIVVGRADLVATVQAVASPVHGLGRAFKSSKEDIIGTLRAVELALEADEAARYAVLLARAERVAANLSGVPGIAVSVLPDGRQGQPCPRTVVRLLPTSGWRRSTFMAALRDGEPGVVVGPLDEDVDALYVHPLGLTDEEADVVAERLKGVLAGASR
jgi:uncharacterized pyridoxal phosphate-dependent enzyme